MSARKPVGDFTVSGPLADDRKRFDAASVALSYALTCTEKGARVGEAVTHYVRDAAGDSVGYVESEVDGTTRVFAGSFR